MVIEVVLPRRVREIVLEHVQQALRLEVELEKVHHCPVPHREELLPPRRKRSQSTHRVARHCPDELQPKQSVLLGQHKAVFVSALFSEFAILAELPHPAELSLEPSFFAGRSVEVGVVVGVVPALIVVGLSLKAFVVGLRLVAIKVELSLVSSIVGLVAWVGAKIRPGSR